MRAIFRQIFNNIIETARQSLTLLFNRSDDPYKNRPNFNDSKKGPIFFDAYDIKQE